LIIAFDIVSLLRGRGDRLLADCDRNGQQRHRQTSRRAHRSRNKPILLLVLINRSNRNHAISASERGERFRSIEDLRIAPAPEIGERVVRVTGRAKVDGPLTFDFRLNY